MVHSVIIIEGRSPEDLTDRINKWIEDTEKHVDIVDMKYSTAANNGIITYHSVLIHYKWK